MRCTMPFCPRSPERRAARNGKRRRKSRRPHRSRRHSPKSSSRRSPASIRPCRHPNTAVRLRSSLCRSRPSPCWPRRCSCRAPSLCLRSRAFRFRSRKQSRRSDRSRSPNRRLSQARTEAGARQRAGSTAGAFCPGRALPHHRRGAAHLYHCRAGRGRSVPRQARRARAYPL